MTIGNGADLKVVQSLNLPDSVVAMNIFYYTADFQEDQPDAVVVGTFNVKMANLYATLEDRVSDLVTMGEFIVYKYNFPADEWDNIGGDVPDVTMGGLSEMLPHGVSGMIRAYTERSRTIGRKYLPGLTEEDNEDGSWSVAGLAALAAFGVEWGGNAQIDVNNTMNPGVFSKVLKTTFPLSDVFVVLAQPAYQRRRRPGVGI